VSCGAKNALVCMVSSEERLLHCASGRGRFEIQGKQEANAGKIRRLAAVVMTGQVATALRGEGFVGAESNPVI
jgi:hypothetical protein